MISPVAVSEYLKAEDNLRRGIARLSRVVRPEIIQLTSNKNSISIDFTFSNHGTSPRVRAIYGDGSSEPEVYIDHADWYNFDASDYVNYFDKSDILMRVIRSELRKALQDFLGVTQVPNTLLEFCLEKNERSTLEIADRSKLFIHYYIDDYQILYDIGPGDRVNLNITNTKSEEVPPFFKSFSLTELIDVEGFVKHQIGNMQDAIHLGDEVIRKVSHVYALTNCSEKFPSAAFCVEGLSFKIELLSDYANIRISSNGITEDFPIGNLDIEAIKRKILSLNTHPRKT
ncbi:hypothetical protein TSMEX_009842 [Taenia solium]|eukprot:TsM_000462300 transcript=TsM_000462300 gene=TsM_000462300